MTTTRFCRRIAASKGPRTPEQAQASFAEVADLPLEQLPAFHEIDPSCWRALIDVQLPRTGTCFWVPTRATSGERDVPVGHHHVTTEVGASAELATEVLLEELADRGAEGAEITHLGARRVVTRYEWELVTSPTHVLRHRTAWAAPEVPSIEAFTEELVAEAPYGDLTGRHYAVEEVRLVHDLSPTAVEWGDEHTFAVSLPRPSHSGWVLVADLEAGA